MKKKTLKKQLKELESLLDDTIIACEEYESEIEGLRSSLSSALSDYAAAVVREKSKDNQISKLRELSNKAHVKEENIVSFVRDIFLDSQV